MIVINGALAAGKSTLAEKYAEEHPLTLKLDVDAVRRNISHFRDHAEESGTMAKALALGMAKVHLQAGHDVVIAQCYREAKHLEKLEKLAQEQKAEFYEFLLSLSKEESVARFIKRGQKEGHPDGFRPDGLVNGVAKIESVS